MTLEERLECLVKCGEILSHNTEEQDDIFRRARLENPWFTRENILSSVSGITDKYLDRETLASWVKQYDFSNLDSKIIGLILAGNIPLVGIHDILAVFVSGHKALIKPSSKDRILCEYFVETMYRLDDRTKKYFELVDRLKAYDAVIATGSDSTGQYFEKYFTEVPHIIRKNRSAVAIITKEDTSESIKDLGEDVFRYFGLGCRNVSKLYLEEGVDVAVFFKAILDFKDVVNHHKYKNNLDYSQALYLMNGEKILTNDFVILRPEKSLDSRIACLHYEYFNSLVDLEIDLNLSIDQIQCVVSQKPIGGFPHIPFGQAQCPGISDYADGVDTLEFLLNLSSKQ